MPRHHELGKVTGLALVALVGSILGQGACGGQVIDLFFSLLLSLLLSLSFPLNLSSSLPKNKSVKIYPSVRIFQEVAGPRTMDDHKMHNSPTTLPSPSAAPCNKYLILTWFLILNIELLQTP